MYMNAIIKLIDILYMYMNGILRDWQKKNKINWETDREREIYKMKMVGVWANECCNVVPNIPRKPSILAKNLLSIARCGTLSINSRAFCKSDTFSPRRCEYFTNSCENLRNHFVCINKLIGLVDFSCLNSNDSNEWYEMRNRENSLLIIIMNKIRVHIDRWSSAPQNGRVYTFHNNSRSHYSSCMEITKFLLQWNYNETTMTGNDMFTSTQLTEKNVK